MIPPHVAAPPGSTETLSVALTLNVGRRIILCNERSQQEVLQEEERIVLVIEPVLVSKGGSFAVLIDGIICDLEGNLVGRRSGRHAQWVSFAKLEQNLPGLQLVCNEKWGGCSAYDVEGDMIWTREECSAVPVRWHPDDPQELLLLNHRLLKGERKAPVLADGHLNPVMSLEHADGLTASRELPKDDPYAQSDYGNCIQYARHDLNGDGIQELIFYNRHTMWVYGGPGTETEV